MSLLRHAYEVWVCWGQFPISTQYICGDAIRWHFRRLHQLIKLIILFSAYLISFSLALNQFRIPYHDRMRKRDVAFFVPSREFTSPKRLYYLELCVIRFYFDSNAFSDTICAMLGKIDWIEWRLVCGRRQSQCFLYFYLPFLSHTSNSCFSQTRGLLWLLWFSVCHTISQWFLSTQWKQKK